MVLATRVATSEHGRHLLEGCVRCERSARCFRLMVRLGLGLGLGLGFRIRVQDQHKRAAEHAVRQNAGGGNDSENRV